MKGRGKDMELILTSFNICLTLASAICAVISVKQTRKQNEYMRQQTEAAQKQTEASQKQIEAAYKQIEITSQQTEIAQKQLEESQKPDYPTTMRLESIAHSIQRLDQTISKGISQTHK